MQYEEMDLFYDMDPEEESEEASAQEEIPDPSVQIPEGSAGDALIGSLRENGRVDLKWMSKASGLSIEELIGRLRGNGIFQDPDHMKISEEYDLSDGWVLAASYLNGNLRQKRMRADAYEKRWPGYFQANLDALDRKLPPRIDIEHIHITLGATWIPEEMYTDFVKELLGVFMEGSVIYEPTLGLWRVQFKSGEVFSVLNEMVYGTMDISALKIIEQTMNARTVKVYDRKVVYEKGDFVTKSFLNKEKTQEAQEKQQKIIEAFVDWCKSDLHRMEELETAYNEEFSSYGTTEFDGTFLEFPDLNPDIHLYPHQINAIARILLSDENVLLAHEVGTGKTYEMICGAHELHRLGLAKRILITMPNQVYQEFLDAHELLYPEDDILAIGPADFRPKNREETLEKIRTSDFTVCYIPHSIFDRIKMTPSYWVEMQQEEIQKVRQSWLNTRGPMRAKLESKLESMTRTLERYRDKVSENPNPGLGFDDLDFDVLFVDEVHKYKNIPLFCKADNVVGLHSEGAVKCKEMVEKCKTVDRMIFSTGTPLTNSLADLFVLQNYLQPDALEDLQISSFDQWINTFAQRETNFEVDVDASSLRPVTRFSTFHNLPELMSLFSTVCDFHYADAHEDLLPAFSGYTDIQVKKTSSQEAYLDVLADRTEQVRMHRVKMKDDNLLKITNDGRRCALDLRLLDIDIPKEEIAQSKISACADQIAKIAEQYPDRAQIVFSDIGTPKKEFNVYDELKKQLIDRGFKPEEVAFIHDVPTEAARKKLFAAVNKAKIKVIIGSTEKLGTGVNIQERLVALHHLSVPWRPADMVQREGRIIRQGNTSPEVFICRYITEGTFDSYSWQLLENKQRFIGSFLSGSSKSRDMDDIADTVLSYAELKALAIGNPLIKERVETANRLEKTKALSRQRQRQLQNLQAEVDQVPEKIKMEQNAIRRVKRDIKLYQEKNRPMTRQERHELGDELLSKLRAFSNNWYYTSFPRQIGYYKGFLIVRNPSHSSDYDPGAFELTLYGHYKTYGYDLKVKPSNGAGLLQSLDYALSHLSDRITESEQAIVRYSENAENGNLELAKGNPHEARIEKLEEKLARIDAVLEEEAQAKEEARKAAYS